MDQNNNVENNTTTNNEVPQVPEAEEAVSVDTSNEVTVINTQKEKKSSPTLLLVLIGLLIVFVFCMDTIVGFVKGFIFKPAPINNVSKDDNQLEQYLTIGEAGQVETDGIKFYSFKKASGNTIEYNYISSNNIAAGSVASIQIYIELYNINKEIIHKELFDVTNGLGKDVVKSYSIQLNSELHSVASYARIRKYSEADLSSEQTLTCTLTDSDGTASAVYKNIYHFKNNELVSYDVTKNVGIEENSLFTKADSEFNSLPPSLGATFSNGVLSYSIDLTSDITGFVPLYTKGTIITNIRSSETNKKWICG